MLTLYFRVRNFEEFQHYRKRNPPWIRLYFRLLQDRRFFRLRDETKYLVIGCFLLASQNGNKIPCDPEWIEKQLSLNTIPDWQSIIDAEFIQPIDCDASALLAQLAKKCSQKSEAQKSDISDNAEVRNTELLSELSEETDRETASLGTQGTEAAGTLFPDTPKSKKQVRQEISEIFKFWNAQPATMHHRSLNGQEMAIASTLRKYPPEEVRRAIERYAVVMVNAEGKYRDLYPWTLGEFLTRKNHYNIERFNAECWELPFLEAGGAGGTKKPGTTRLATDEDKRNYNPNERNN